MFQQGALFQQMANTVSLKFFIPSRVTLGKQACVFVRILCNRQKAELSTGIVVTPTDWDATRERVAKNPRANEELAFIANRIQEIRRALVLAGLPVSARVLKERFLGKHERVVTLLEYFQLQVDRIAGMKQGYAPATARGYQSAYKHIEGFLTLHKQRHLSLAQVDYGLLQRFDQYLLSQGNLLAEGGLLRNSCAKQHARLKTVLGWAVKEGLISQNPYGQFPIKHEASRRTFLSHDELSRLQAHPLAGNESLLRVRDFFLLSVYTGLRYKDVVALRREHLQTDGEGRRWLELVQDKTGELLHVPLLEPAWQILERYAAKAERGHGTLLPPMSNQKLNAYLKTIADLAGISKRLTHHMARHTYATTITLANDVPLEVVSKLLGHRSVKTTQIYAKITNRHLAQVTDRLNEKLKVAGV
jgi:site-specific recombinase XerD